MTELPDIRETQGHPPVTIPMQSKPCLNFGNVGDSLGKGEISSSRSVQPVINTESLLERNVSLIGPSNGVFTVNIHAKARDIVSSLRVLNDTVGSTKERVTGTSIVSLKSSFVETKLCLESTLTVLLGVIEKLHGHSDIEDLRIQEIGGVMESRQCHFYDSLSLHLPPDLMQDVRSSFPSASLPSLTTCGSDESLSSVLKTESDDQTQREGEDDSNQSSVSSSFSPKSPLTYRKLSSLQMNDNKFVFAVDDPVTEQEYVMKETTVTSNDDLNTIMNEYKIIKMLHEDGVARGIINKPECYEESIRSTMIYDMHVCDLFNFINEHCVLKATRGVPEDAATQWIAQMLVAIRSMIKKGIVHRDLKPENILLDSNCNIVVSDFELAKEMKGGGVAKSDSDEFNLVGTPLYIPPEVGTKKFADLAKYDIWSIGVIAWELVTDTNPWGVNVDRMPAYEVLQMTNKTSKLNPKAKPRDMSNLYFDFISKVVCNHADRMSVEEAMEHNLFRGLDFSDPSSIFPNMSVHRNLVDIAPTLYSIRGAQTKKNNEDKNRSPKRVSRKLESSSSEIKYDEIKAEVNKMQCWIRQQSYLPSEEKMRKVSEQNEMLKCFRLSEVRKMPKSDLRGAAKPSNKHRKVVEVGKKTD
ncbi:hypothetical protein TrCOL_g11450 [Triparma columacea]|uniref:Protein kinase domain-containing protein n=1 Tax=Triparma columacea TaxID=722753 RepID=A0A9W7GLR7_9STRA|nr:hypothetical protein TrCOL_g11450 [Triparma columacea]